MVTEKAVTLRMPLVQKEGTGQIYAVLSDDSVDRQGERIAPELIRRWAETEVLPALVDHSRKIESIVAVWKNLRVVEANGRTALVAEPDWLTDEFSRSVKRKVEELLAKGLKVGVSIGAIPKESRVVSVDGKQIREWTDAELVEASFVAVPANRNAGAWNASYESAEIVVKSLDAVEKTPAVPPAALLNDALRELKGLKTFLQESVEDSTVVEGAVTIINKVMKTIAAARDAILSEKNADGVVLMDKDIEKAKTKITVTRRAWTAPKQSERKKLPKWVFLDPENLRYPVFEWKHLLNGGRERILNCNAVRVAIAYSAKYGHAEVYNKAKRLWQRYCAREEKAVDLPELAKDAPEEVPDDFDYVEDFECPDCPEFEDFEDEWDEEVLGPAGEGAVTARAEEAQDGLGEGRAQEAPQEGGAEQAQGEGRSTDVPGAEVGEEETEDSGNAAVDEKGLLEVVEVLRKEIEELKKELSETKANKEEIMKAVEKLLEEYSAGRKGIVVVEDKEVPMHYIPVKKEKG